MRGMFMTLLQHEYKCPTILISVALYKARIQAWKLKCFWLRGQK